MSDKWKVTIIAMAVLTALFSGWWVTWWLLVEVIGLPGHIYWACFGVSVGVAVVREMVK